MVDSNFYNTLDAFATRDAKEALNPAPTAGRSSRWTAAHLS
jgi:hypothetical protein